MASKKFYQNVHQALIDKLKNQDREAQFQIYKLYYKAMFNTSLRIIGNSQEAEDIMQEAFLKAFTKIKSYNGEVSFGAWLKRIVINASLDVVKKNKLLFEEIDNIENEKESINEETKEDREIIESEVAIVKEAIKKLPEGYRIVLSLYFVEGYDHEEISNILDVSGSTSRTQFIRAKKRLIEILNK